jgi:hypothetical protein
VVAAAGVDGVARQDVLVPRVAPTPRTMLGREGGNALGLGWWPVVMKKMKLRRVVGDTWSWGGQMITSFIKQYVYI